jgi:hypothetical protein
LAQVLWVLLCLLVVRVAVSQGRPDALALEVAPTALVLTALAVEGRQRLSARVPRRYFQIYLLEIYLHLFYDLFY